jgi:hypothetical protein
MGAVGRRTRRFFLTVSIDTPDLKSAKALLDELDARI